MMKRASALLIVIFLSQTEHFSNAYRVGEGEDALDQQDERMYPEHEMFVSRRRQDPIMEDGSQVDIYQDTDSKSVSVISNLSPSLQDVIDTKINKNLPPNYHNTTIYVLQHNGKTVRVNVTINKATNPKTGFESIAVVETTNDTSFGFDCSKDNPCQTGMYCRKMLVGHFCSKCKNDAEKCSSDMECCGRNTVESLCVNGKCKNGFKKGEMGTLCENSKDCNYGLCCANEFMAQAICRPLAKLGERCITSYRRTHFEAIIDGDICPCEHGLSCRPTHSIPFIELSEDLLGESKCSATPKQKGTWFSGILEEFDNEEEPFNF